MSKKLRVLTQILIALVLVAAGGSGLVLLTKSKPPLAQKRAPEVLPMVRTVTVGVSALPVKVMGEGTVTASVQSTLASQVTGQVIYAAPALTAGGMFAKGDVLIKVDPRDYELAVTLSQAKVRQAETALKEVQEESEVAKEEWKRVHGQNAPPLPPLVAKTPQLTEARAQLEAARAQLAQARLDLERTELKAPYAGRVIENFVDLGQYVRAGDKVATVFATHHVKIVVPLEDRHLAWISVPGLTSHNAEGSLATVRAFFAGQEHTWQGQVVRAEGKLDERTRLVPVVVRVKDPYAQMPPLTVGMYVQVEFAGRELTQAVVLPRVSLKDEDTVWVVDENGILSFRTVEVAPAQRGFGDHHQGTQGRRKGGRVPAQNGERRHEGAPGGHGGELMNRAIAWFAGNHVAANLLMLFFVAGGLVMAFTMKIEVFPETSLDKISITVEYPGASPAEVEESVTSRIEEKIAGIDGVRRIDSVSREGMSSITVELMQGWDLAKALDEVKAEVDRITTLPDEAEKPLVREITRRAQVLWAAVYGDAPESTLKALAEQMQDDITNLPGVTVTELFGVREGEILIEVSEDTLRRYGLTLQQVAQAVAKSSLDLPAGSIKTKGAEIMLRAKGRRYHAEDYANVPILTNPDGSQITLGQIAKLKDGFEDSDLYARFQGKPAALIQVYRVADQNALSVASEVKQYLKQLEPNLPAGISAGVFGDRAIILKSRLDLLLRNMAFGLALVALVLGAFLEVRLAFWVALGIPISFLVSIFFLPRLDVSINMISLFAFILVLGIVVDDAIVVGENIFKKREEGVTPLKAAIEGAIEVGPPVVFSVLTTVAAFAPLLMGTGMMGKVMRNIPVVVIMVLMGSLLESLFILPAHLARSRAKIGPAATGRREKITSRWLKRFIAGPYARILDLSLRWRYATVALGLCILLLAVGTFTGGWLKFTLFPKVEGDILQAHLTMVPGTPVERTTEVVKQIEAAAEKGIGQEGAKISKTGKSLLDYSVSLVGVQTGGPHGAGDSGSHVATVFAQLLNGEERDVNAEALNQRWRETMPPVPDADTLSFQSEIFSPGNAIEVHLSHADDSVLKAAVADLKASLKAYPGVFDVSDSFTRGKDELQIDLKPTGRTLGLTLSEVSSQVRHAFYGAEALRLQRDKDEVKVMVRYPEAERKSLGDIERMRIRTPDGMEVPFAQVAQVRLAQSYASIDRAQRRRVVKVTGDVNENISNANEIRQDITEDVMPALAARYPGLRYDMEGAAREQRESMADVQQGFLLALFGIYVLLAIPFRSFSQPFIVMAAIPFGVVGAMVGHLIMGMNLSILSLFGIVGLSGVVVNDSLLLVHQANRLRADEGLSVWEAVRQAGALRFRPILLTSVTTFAGLTPIILEKSLQAQFLIPMAVSLGFGVIFATGITLILIPCGYLIQDDIVRGMRKLLGIKPREVETAELPH